MNIDNLKDIRFKLNNELSSSLKQDYGKDVFTKLCYIINELNSVIDILEHPEEWKKIKKLVDGR